MNSQVTGYSIETETPLVSLLRVTQGYTTNFGDAYDSRGDFINFPRELGDKNLCNNLENLAADALKLNRKVVASVVHQQTNYSYFHWTYETLPKLIYLSQNRQKIKFDKIYYHCGFFGTPYQREALRTLGFSRFQLLDAKKVVAVAAQEVIIPRLNVTQRDPSLALCTSIKDTFIKTDHPNPFRKLYLTRRNVKSGRKILNEEALLKLLAAYDFQMIDPGQLSFSQQINCFNEASFIVSPHGAALSNIVFCQPGTKILELFNHGNIKLGSQSYVNISKTCGLDLIRIPSQAHEDGDESTYSNRSSFTVDLDLLESQIQHWSLSPKD